MTHAELFAIQIVLMAVQIGGFWIGYKKLKPDIGKTKAEEQSALGEAAESAGVVADMAWKRIADLENKLDSAQKELADLKKEFRNVENYRNALEALLIQNKIPVPPFVPLDTNPKMRAVKS